MSSDLSDNSDTSDDDYEPTAKPEEAVSEVESDGDAESPLSETEEDAQKRGQKRRKRNTKSRKKPKKIDQERDDDDDNNDNKQEELSAEDKKKKEDDLWADFMKDTGFKSKGSTANSKVSVAKTSPPKLGENKINKAPDKVKITQVFEFAGEEVTIEKEVSANSAEARLLSKPAPDAPKPGRGRSKGGLGGISSVLSQLGKKPKISTLEKSKLDWDKFKKEENIEEELQTHNKGKDGYLERQDFLQRADVRRFEIEREIRTVERSKRMNN